jgi:Rod binding domain-containing protein
MVDKIPPFPASAPPDSRSSPDKIEHAAKQFESLLIGQILKSMHEAGSSGWMGGGEDQSGESAMELAEEQFAQALASRGGFGLSRLIIQGLTKPEKSSVDPAAAKLR